MEKPVYRYSFTVDKPITMCDSLHGDTCPFFESSKSDGVFCGHPNRPYNVPSNGELYAEPSTNMWNYKKPDWCPLGRYEGYVKRD